MKAYRLNYPIGVGDEEVVSYFMTKEAAEKAIIESFEPGGYCDDMIDPVWCTKERLLDCFTLIEIEIYA